MLKRNWFLAFFLPIFFIQSVYDFSFTSIDNTKFSFSQFKGKKILIVNSAWNSKYRSQLNDLVTLQQQHQDSLVIIVFPSNSFGNDLTSNSAILDSIKTNVKPNYVIANQIEVAGANADPLYFWLADTSNEDKMGNPVKQDFQKFLISPQGDIIGVFASSATPLGEELKYALK